MTPKLSELKVQDLYHAKMSQQARVYVLTLRGSHTVAGWDLCQMGAACMKLLGHKLWLILQIRAFLSQGWVNKSFSLTSCTSFRWSPSNCGQISCRYLRNACPCEMGHVTCLLVTLHAFLVWCTRFTQFSEWNMYFIMIIYSLWVYMKKYNLLFSFSSHNFRW